MRVHRRWGFAFVAAALLGAAPAARGGDTVPAAEVLKIPAGGGTLEATLHRPAKANGCGVVLAPGQGGGRERPLFKRTAEGLATAGFTVLRFDWTFFTAKGQPSEAFAAEAADLDAAVRHVRALPGIAKLLIAGKSLGTLATAARLAAKPDDAAGLLMLTPALVQDDAGTPFPGIERLFGTRVPVVMVAGDHDPLCPLPLLYRLAEKATSPPRIVVVPGDHGLAKARGDDSETEDNVGLAVAAVVLWARRLAGV
jgi:predicted alpha/beta-hydrolase family hydrolase